MDLMIEGLPKQLRMKLSAFAYEKRYSNLKFFKDRSV